MEDEKEDGKRKDGRTTSKSGQASLLERPWRRQGIAMSGNSLFVRVREAPLRPLRLRENKKKYFKQNII